MCVQERERGGVWEEGKIRALPFETGKLGKPWNHALVKEDLLRVLIDLYYFQISERRNYN